MSNQASTSSIAAYLANIKKLLSAGKYDFVPRRKNMQERASMKKYCEECGREVEAKVITKKETYDVCSEPIEVDAQVLVVRYLNRSKILKLFIYAIKHSNFRIR